MSEIGSGLPVSEEQAKAIQEALKTLRSAGDYLREVLGTVPEDVVALLGGNWLKVKRAENLIRTVEKARERLNKDHIKFEPASLSIGLPILIAAADESREELQEIWARLLVAAADPNRSKSFRLAFIEAAKKLDPLDVGVLLKVRERTQNMILEGTRQWLASVLTATPDQILVSPWQP